MTDTIRIHSVASLEHQHIVGLSEVLIDCVEGGASVSFHAADHARQGRGVLAAHGREPGARRVAAADRHGNHRCYGLR